ncbi:hypothetical protein AN963_20590 [Brevibacillus choshinensis]|uniref:Uncharacterized protein n=1 Tax=Brevibacillus choshinensis TaxID=54911 RepID=A0ABR5N040_BRECH|nr:hypothetical protein [Brevibacillus choshinensis]KQL43870.1 hypothetical protein AN963_20590 [Brevibacillus choshinensis]
MAEEFEPRIELDATIVSPDRETEGERLDPERFHDLYKLAGEEGLPYFARLNGRGEAELFLVFESVDAFSEQTRDAVSIEFKAYQNKLLAVIWTLSDPLQPLGFPLSFDIQKAEERHMAQSILNQAATPIHYLAYEEGNLTHIYTESISLSAEEVERTEGMIRSLFAGTPEELPHAAEVREEETETIYALSLSREVLQEDGVAFVLDYRRMMGAHGEEEAQHLLMRTVQQAVWVMRRHSRSEVRDSTFSIWVAEKGELLYLVVTPQLTHLFEVVHMSEDEANPFARFLMTLPAFVRCEDVSPLQTGAYPLLRYEKGRLYHLELDEHVQVRLDELHREAFSGHLNPYQ